MIACRVLEGRWADSARMMAAARAAESQDGVTQAACFMATPANVAEARGLGLWHGSLDDAGPGDVAIVASGDDPERGVLAASAALAGSAEEPGGGVPTPRTRSLRATQADLAVVSVPGEYAAIEAHKALGAGMDVLLFSDGVSLDDEIALKRRAHREGRLVMGPGAGTAILDGVGLGFANAVSRGPVGVAAAAGTGAQEITVLLDAAGAGVSACYGTGGRDLGAAVGARSMLDAIARLDADPGTEVIVVVSKPPAAEVASRVLDALGDCGTPAVACFVGGPAEPLAGVTVTQTLEEAAVAAAAIAGAPGLPEWSAPGLAGEHDGDVRGLFAGGTLCGEAAAILASALGDVTSNAPAGGARRLTLGGEWAGHVCVDLGEEEFTRGRPHPMIDPLARAELIEAEGGRPETAVLLLDVVLGYASHPDPAGALTPAIETARRRNPDLMVVCHVLGTDADPQPAGRQVATMEGAGAIVCPTNAAAARLAAALVA